MEARVNTFIGWIDVLKYNNSVKNAIPQMTHPYGKSWSQPDTSEIKVSSKYAEMTIGAFNSLHDYSRSIPSAVYEGKMWKSVNKLESATDEVIWYLHWWSEHPTDKSMCKQNVREIKIIK